MTGPVGVLESILHRRRMVLTAAALLAVSGIASWLGMIRQEDPSMPDFWGMVVVTFPGADAETMERLVVEPLEEDLAEVTQLKLIESTARAEVAILQLELDDTTRDVPAAWDDVRRAVADARADLPAGAGEPLVRDDLRDQESIVLAITGSSDLARLGAAAEQMKKGLVALPLVSRVEITADPEDQITVEMEPAVAARLGLDAPRLAAQLAERNRILPGGTVRLGGKQVTLRPLSELASVAELAATPVVLPSGAAVPLSEVAKVRRGPREPATARMRVDGEMAVGLGVIPRREVNVVDFGRSVRERVEQLRAGFPDLTISEVLFQPDRVERRLDDLSRSLAIGILIVAAVLVLSMGLRLGLVVASVVPLVALAALSFYALGGGVLHQISIAALVIALGMLVDNAIVVAETVQARVDAGESAASAATGAVRELALPLAGATGTTIAAFIPMLAASGTTAIFTRAIPLVIVLTLTISYVFAVAVTPGLAQWVLRPGSKVPAGAAFARLAGRLARLAVGRPAAILIAGTLVVALAAWAATGIRGQFFPASDRNQVLVDLELPEGAHLDETDRVARRLERALAEQPAVVSVASFLGRSTPHFYYNLNQVPQSPNLAQLIVTTRSTAEVDATVRWIRDYLRREVPEVAPVARKLEQGPPVAAPIEIRLYGSELADLDIAASRVKRAIEQIPGTVDVRHNLGIGVPTLRFRIDDAAAARHGLARSNVARALFGTTRGLPVGDFRGEDQAVPIVVRAPEGETLPVERLAGITVASGRGAPGAGDGVPLAQVAEVEVDWRPAAIHHRNGERAIAVLSQLEGDTTHSEVLATLLPQLDAMELPASVRWEVGGEAEGSGEANQAIARAAPLGMLLLVGILLAEFNSFRRVAIILITVPLAATGVVPGLLLADQPFGFMSLLGVVALVGVVVNNAIVLLDVTEREREAGATIEAALITAVERRTRPILLTTATTVAGLLPLALSSSPLWPPMASAMISGLLASTLLTLLVVPALYRVLFTPPRGWRALLGRRRAIEAVTAMLAAAWLLTAPASAAAQAPAAELGAEQGAEQTVTFEQALAAAAGRPLVAAAQAQAQAAEQEAVAARRAAWWPALSGGAAAQWRSDDQTLTTPIGDFTFGERRIETAQLGISQPLLDPAGALFVAPAARARAAAARQEGEHVHTLAIGAAGSAFLDAAGLAARMAATEALIESLEGRLAEVEQRVAAGRVLESEALKVRLARDSARQELLALGQAREVAHYALGRAIAAPGPVTPALAPWPASASTPDPAASAIAESLPALVARGLRQRCDLAALELRRQALAKERGAVRAERWPRLDAGARWSWTSGSPFAEQDQLEGTLGLTWTPFASGTRAPRAAALAQGESALRSQSLELRRQVELEVRAALAGLATARGAVALAETARELAAETLRVEAERFAAGRSSANDLLAAEGELRDRRAGGELARLDLLRARLALALAVGEPELALAAASGPTTAAPTTATTP